MSFISICWRLTDFSRPRLQSIACLADEDGNGPRAIIRSLSFLSTRRELPEDETSLFSELIRSKEREREREEKAMTVVRLASVPSAEWRRSIVDREWTKRSDWDWCKSSESVVPQQEKERHWSVRCSHAVWRGVHGTSLVERSGQWQFRCARTAVVWTREQERGLHSIDGGRIVRQWSGERVRLRAGTSSSTGNRCCRRFPPKQITHRPSQSSHDLLVPRACKPTWIAWRSDDISHIGSWRCSRRSTSSHISLWDTSDQKRSVPVRRPPALTR